MQHRDDVQILRGIAVLVVLLFHLSPELLPSGFFGVDIFFVISGFLMAALYYRKGEDHLARNFYRRRFHRVLPAYYLALLATAVAGGFLLLPHESAGLTQQIFASALFIPNIFFWSGEAYFSDIELRPLLHTWSLGVEIQFYLLVPIFYWLISKQRLLFFAVFLGSLASCFIVLQHSAKSAFFLLPFRLWEFFIGFCAAYFLTQSGNIRTRIPALGAAAITALLVLSAIKIDIQEHPGFAALAVCLCTAAVLIVGLPKLVEKSFTGRALALAGNYSYSLYLVHFPIIIFMYYQPFQGERHATTIDGRLIATLALIAASAYISYHWFETKRLTGQTFTKNKLIALLAGLALMLSPVFLYFNKHLFDDSSILISDAIHDRSPWRCGKLGKLKQILDRKNNSCTINEIPSENTGVLLVGDSHADSLKMAVAEAAARNNRTAHLVTDSCTLGNNVCKVDSILAIAERNGISTVVLHDLYYNTNYDALASLLDKKPEFLQVIFVEPVPTYKTGIPEYLYTSLKQKRTAEQISIHDLSFYLEKYERYFSQLNHLAENSLTRVPVLDIFCNPGCKLADDDGRPYYFDNHHLTLTGAATLKERLVDFLKLPEVKHTARD